MLCVAFCIDRCIRNSNGINCTLAIFTIPTIATRILTLGEILRFVFLDRRPCVRKRSVIFLHSAEPRIMELFRRLVCIRVVLGPYWGSSKVILDQELLHDGPKMAPRGPKMATSWPKRLPETPRWPQAFPEMAAKRPKMAP